MHLIELAIEGGCKTFPKLKAIKKQDKKSIKLFVELSEKMVHL